MFRWWETVQKTMKKNASLNLLVNVSMDNKDNSSFKVLILCYVFRSLINTCSRTFLFLLCFLDSLYVFCWFCLSFLSSACWTARVLQISECAKVLARGVARITFEKKKKQQIKVGALNVVSSDSTICVNCHLFRHQVRSRDEQFVH